MPTTIILRFSDDTIDDITKVKYHKWLNEKIPDLQLPESEEEENLDSQSDSKYESVIYMGVSGMLYRYMLF